MAPGNSKTRGNTGLLRFSAPPHPPTLHRGAQLFFRLVRRVRGEPAEGGDAGRSGASLQRHWLIRGQTGPGGCGLSAPRRRCQGQQTLN